MLRFFVSVCLLAGLAGCAAVPPPAREAARMAARPASPPARLDQGTIVARHRVPSDDPQPIRRLFDRLGAMPAAADATEFIVHADDGATLSIVGPGRPALQVGTRVEILRGQPTRLVAAEHVLAAR